MHHVSGLLYVGQPNETVSLTTQVAAGGQITVTLDGQPIPGDTQFRLPSSPGTPCVLQVSLFGPIGASCAVGLAVVDGGTDGDFLLCQVHNPAPVHVYTFGVASAASVKTFTDVTAGTSAKKPSGAQRRGTVSRRGRKK